MAETVRDADGRSPRAPHGPEQTLSMPQSTAISGRRYNRKTNHNGTPRAALELAAEGDRLRPLFLQWVGKRSNAEGLRLAGIPYNAGSAWMSGRSLPAHYHANVKRVIGEPA